MNECKYFSPTVTSLTGDQDKEQFLVRSLRRAVGAVAALSTAFVLVACGGESSEDSPAGTDTLVLGSTATPQSFDPAGVGDANFVPYAQAAYDTLIYRTPKNEYEPMLATEWEFSDDNLLLSLTLREGVTFSDGTPFNAEAVKANLEHFASGGGPLATQLATFDSAQVVDDTHIEVQLSAPIPDLIYNLSDAAGRMASPKALGDPGLQTVPVGTGPYVMDVESTVQGSTYAFTARKDYWKPELQEFEKIDFKIFTDEVALLNALKSGQVQAGNLSSQDNITEAERAGIEILHPEYHISWAGLIIFDRTGKLVPELADVRVRRAIAHAVDGQSILDAVFLGNGAPNAQVFNEASPAYDPALNETYAYDPDLAKSLLAEAGYSDGFTLTMPVVSGFMAPALQEAIKTQLDAVGITVKYETIDSANFISDLLAGKYPVSYMFLGSVPTDWFVVQSYLKPDSAWNPFGAQAPKLDALIEAIPPASEDERDQLYSEINKFVVDNAWFTPWFWVEENYAVASDAIEVELQQGQNVPSIYNYSSAS